MVTVLSMCNRVGTYFLGQSCTYFGILQHIETTSHYVGHPTVSRYTSIRNMTWIFLIGLDHDGYMGVGH